VRSSMATTPERSTCARARQRAHGERVFMAMTPSGMAGLNAPVEATASWQVVRLDDDRSAPLQVRCTAECNAERM